MKITILLDSEFPLAWEWQRQFDVGRFIHNIDY